MLPPAWAARAEVDATFECGGDRHTTLLFGYGRFFAGEFVGDANPAASDDIDFLDAAVDFRFAHHSPRPSETMDDVRIFLLRNRRRPNID